MHDFQSLEIAEVTRDPYPDPHDRESKMMVADLRAMERLPRQIPLDELRNNASVRKVKFLKNGTEIHMIKR